jgi:epoxyqueuosine reductase
VAGSDAKDAIKNYARSIGVAAIGVTGPERFDIVLPIYKKRIERGYLSGFEEKNLELRLDPHLSMPEVKSIISLAVPYNVDYRQEKKPKYHGQVARVGWGRDYHVVVTEKMTKLAQFIRELYPDLKYHMMVDGGPLMDRAVAWRAGLGWIGKNNTLIVPRVGSYVFLGEILIDKYLESDSPLKMSCGECEQCLKACPTGALVEPFTLNTKTCLSYLTQTAEQIPDWVVPKMEGRIYGCDICQDACPHNVGAPKIGDRGFVPSTIEPYPDLIELASMDPAHWIETVGQTAGEWVGRGIIQRNAIVGLSDYDDPQILSFLQKLQDDPRALISDTARWAHDRISSRISAHRKDE